ncbi:TRAUB-domain-containing protein [Microthyrium microscopicum]|uniref:Protein BFR2 n=1 Tax=Microthyrium microscopicum TaxID=703497 RepID=A0A6A6UE16_9PEZI|nr:TRAUB-domain-containing protein [Microthyrium microscopicum]
MAPSKKKTLAQQIADLNDTTPRDVDPEDLDLYNKNADDSSDPGSEENENAGREHYEEVEKSKLRKPVQAALGAAYRGSRVSRDAVDESDEDDPFAREYSDSDRDGEKMDDDDDDEILQDFDTDDSDVDMDVENNSTGSQDEQGSEEDQSRQRNGDTTMDMSELRRLVTEDQKTVAATLTNAAKTDVSKGEAIKTQRSTFDSLLNVRIKLQRALISTNSLVEAPEENVDEAQDALKGAEMAAMRLWNTLDSLKMSLLEERTGKKRKHVELDESSLTSTWTGMQAYEKEIKRQRNSNMDMWASKTRAAATVSQSRRLNDSAPQQSLSDVLASQMSEMSRLVAKTTIPRSCAPIQAAASKSKSKAGVDDENSVPIYDDADFYGPLLQALVAQRSSDAAALSAMNVSFVSQPWQAAREARTRKIVDTKASKGRKLRYTVHEKLQNIMAPENRASWSDRQCDELFASLQGRKVALQDHDSDAEEGSRDVAAEGLRLFATA